MIPVGKSFDGEAAEVVDAPDKVVTPGFIDTHVPHGAIAACQELR